jgi:hypothetical protein
VSIQFGALSGRRPEAVEQMAALVRQHRVANEPVGEYHEFVRNLVFYVRFRQEYLSTEARAVEFMRSPERVLMVVRDTDVGPLEAAAGIRMRRLGAVRYLDTAGLRLATLLSREPQTAVQNILLVTNR